VGPLARKRHPYTAAHYVPRHHHGRCASLRTRGFVCTAEARRQSVGRMETREQPRISSVLIRYGCNVLQMKAFRSRTTVQ
jgi:hypothetical protein